MIISKFRIEKMDCTAEESLIRMKLDSYPGIKKMEFDLMERELTVYHQNETTELSEKLNELNLGSNLLTSENIENEILSDQDEINRKYLMIVLLINFSFFIIEFVVGFIGDSMGLVGDSLDMLADAFVYGMSFIVIGRTLVYKKRVAMLTGYLQLGLSLLGYSEVIRRFAGIEELPNYLMMIVVSVFALAANTLSLYILLKSKSKEVHMKATMICTSNDIIVNAGVIAAGILVLLLRSQYPDLIIGVIIFTMVLRGAVRILKLS